MSISIIILISFFYHGYLKKLRFLFLVPIPLMIFTIAESGSRLAFISFFLSILVFFLIQKNKYLYQRIIMLLIFILSLVILYFFISQYQFLIYRILGTLFMGEISGRDESFLIIFKIIKDNFLLVLVKQDIICMILDLLIILYWKF